MMMRSLRLVALMQLVAGAVVFVGNSLTAPNNVTGTRTPYPTLLQGMVGPASGLQWHNLGMGGWTTFSLIDNAAAVDALYSPDPDRTNVLVAWEITNDLVGNQPAGDVTARMQAYCRDRQKVGWTVLCLTCLPRSWSAPITHTVTVEEFAARRAAVNATLRATANSFCNALIDVGGADCVLGPDVAALNTAYYDDGTHITTAGSAIVARMVADAIYSLPLASSPILPDGVGHLLSTLAVTETDGDGRRVITTHNGSAVLDV